MNAAVMSCNLTYLSYNILITIRINVLHFLADMCRSEVLAAAFQLLWLTSFLRKMP